MTPRVIRITGSIDDGTYANFSEELDTLLSENNKPITLEICSCGGEDNIALGIYDKMMTCKAPINTIAYGEVQSAAVLIFAAGKTRIASENVAFMVHESSEKEGWVSTTTRKREANRMERAEYVYYSLLAKHTRLTYEMWRSHSEKTLYFSTKDAKNMGLVDAILVPKPNKRKK